MPPDNMAIDMRHLKLKPEEAALLSGELSKPSWQSKNEGIHERVSFEDAIWGFDLAGGSYYKTPLRVVGVKAGSRAEKAGIRPGDRLKRINDIDSSTLTIQEAHEIIIASGVHLKLAVTAPEDEEDAYFCYEDPMEEAADDGEAERLRLEALKKKRIVHAKVRSDWSLQWPWVSRKRVIYRESNCFMVPSKYESKHRDKFPLQPTIRMCDEGFVKETVRNTETKDDPEKTENIDGTVSEGKSDLESCNSNKNIELKEANNEIGDKVGNDEQSTHSSVKKIENSNEVTAMDTDERNLSTDNHSEIESSESHSQSNANVVNNDNIPEDLSQDINENNEKEDKILNELYETTENLSKNDEEHVLNSILSEDEHTGVDER